MGFMIKRYTNRRVFAGTWRPLVGVITTLYYVAPVVILSSSSVVSRAFSALCVRVFDVRTSSSSPRLPLCQI